MRSILRKNFSILCLLALITSATVTSADTVGPGDVSGTWTLAGSPWLIAGEVTVPVGQTLVIEPGVEVIAQGWYSLSVHGQLLAVGAENDTISFSADDVNEGWRGVRFYDTTPNGQPLSELRYCRVENGRVSGSCPDNSGGAIYCGYSDPLIANNLITRNSSVFGLGNWGGGGIYCDYSSPTIRDNVITGNSTGGDGGGICCYFSHPEISGNVITDNSASRGDGIACFLYSSPTITGNTVSGNHGRGLYLSGGTAVLVNNVISDNTGGGIHCYITDPYIVSCLITGNSAGSGGGIYLEGSSPFITNCTIADNDAGSGGGLGVTFVFVGIFSYSFPILTNTIFWDNTASTGSQIYTVNGNLSWAEYCDVQDKDGAGVDGPFTESTDVIDADPSFMTSGDLDCHLNPGSPCRDTGTPSAELTHLPDFDLAGTARVVGDRIDMGALECTGSSSVPDTPGARALISGVRPNPFNPMVTISLSLARSGPVELAIYDVTGRRVRSLFVGGLDAGRHDLRWNGRDDAGHELAAGVYLCRVWSGGEIDRRSVTLVK